MHTEDTGPPTSDSGHLQQAPSGSPETSSYQPGSETVPMAVLKDPPSSKPGADFGKSTLEFFSLA